MKKRKKRKKKKKKKKKRKMTKKAMALEDIELHDNIASPLLESFHRVEGWLLPR